MRSERDKLLAEKESWSRSPGGDSSAVVRPQLEAEKMELTKARDEALERLKVSNPVLLLLSLLTCYLSRLLRNVRTRRLMMLGT